MDYVGTIFRPPSEAYSGLLQVAVGCSHNRCAFCAMYSSKRFKPKPWDVVYEDIKELARARPRRVFLCDGDALILPTDTLLQILEAIRAQMPWLDRVSTYGDARSILRKPVDELIALQEAGLEMVYHGVESGDDVILERINKGSTAAEAAEAAERLRAAGILHSVMVLLGLGGAERSAQHAEETAKLLSRMDPAFVGALTLTLVPGTPLSEAADQGRFELPDKFGLLRELRHLVAHSALSNCRFSSNHASNYLPIRASLPDERERVLAALDAVLEAHDERVLRPEHLRAL